MPHPAASPQEIRAMKFPLLGKTLAVGGVLIALTLALQSIGAIVHEREGRLHEAERSVADSLASQQTLVGPVLLRRCEETWTSEQGEGKEAGKSSKLVTEKRDFALAATPATLDVSAKAAIETRHRGIFKVNGYGMRATMKARFADLAALEPVAEHAGSTLRCEAPVMFVAVGDARGIRVATISVGGAALPVLPGTEHASHPRGFHAVIPAALQAAAKDAGGVLQAEVAIELVGTGDLAFAPVADTTHVALASDWPHPSFAGRFLPNERTIDARGFTANWQLSALATSAPQELINGGAVCALSGNHTEGKAHCIETFGVAFIDPVSGYVLSDRATKYGLLFIALTFVGVGLVEVLKRLRVHPVQYLLVGSALAVFFLLLVSLTEHIAFAWAYLAASAACTLLLGFYASYVLRGVRAGAVFGAAIAALYGALYLLLQMEQSALVLGSLLLFAVLGAVMVATRRVDWYALMEGLRRDAAAPAAKLAQ
jgi:inner membrane protein